MSGHRVLHDAMLGPLAALDPGASGTITVTKNFEIYDCVTAAAEARALAAPTRAGIYCIIRLMTDGGDMTMTAASAVNVAGNTICLFEDAGDQLFMVSVGDGSGGFRWEIIVNTGSVGLS